MSDAQVEELRETLLAGAMASEYLTDLRTFKRVSLPIEKLFGIKYGDVNVWHILGSMGFSSQKPEKFAIERKADAVAYWTRRDFPALNKSRKNNA